MLRKFSAIALLVVAFGASVAQADQQPDRRPPEQDYEYDDEEIPRYERREERFESQERMIQPPIVFRNFDSRGLKKRRVPVPLHMQQQMQQQQVQPYVHQQEQNFYGEQPYGNQYVTCYARGSGVNLHFEASSTDLNAARGAALGQCAVYSPYCQVTHCK